MAGPWVRELVREISTSRKGGVECGGRGGGSPPNAAAHAQLQQKLQQQNLQRQREKFNMACRSLWRP